MLVPQTPQSECEAQDSWEGEGEAISESCILTTTGALQHVQPHFLNKEIHAVSF